VIKPLEKWVVALTTIGGQFRCKTSGTLILTNLGKNNVMVFCEMSMFFHEIIKFIVYYPILSEINACC
jgi:hypothetical protein